MRSRIYIICLLGSLWMLGSCNEDDKTSVDANTSIVSIEGHEYTQTEEAALLDNGSVFFSKLLSVRDGSSIEMAVYFDEDGVGDGNSCLQPKLICYTQNNDYRQIALKQGKATLSSVGEDSFNILFEECDFGENSYISGDFSVHWVAEEASNPRRINIWGQEHPFRQWINEGTQQWAGTTLLNIQNTEAHIYLSEKNDAPSPAVVICPGGAYSCLEPVHEGRLVAEWFAKHGVTGVVLHYCLPNSGHPEIPLSDLQETMRYLRNNFATYKIRPDRIGVMGFSAGGHLASLLSTHFNIDEQINVIHPEMAYRSRPDFTILCYPVITMREPYTHASTKENLLGKNPSDALIDICSSERQITPQTPPALLFHSENDNTVPLENSRMYYQNLIQLGIKSRLVVFPTGGHGWGFSESNKLDDELKNNILQWLDAEGFVP